MKRKIITLVSGAALCLGLAALVSNIKPTPISANAGTLYSGGSGTENDPFLISTPEDWYALADATQSEDENAPQEGLYFELTNDITVTKGLGPVTGTTDVRPFAGTFNGNNYSITLNASGMGSRNGLFLKNTGLIKNLVRKGKNSGAYYQGGIVAFNAGTIENCINYADIAISGYAAGGIAAWNCDSNYAGKIINCVNYGDIYTLGNNQTASGYPFYSDSQCIGGISGYVKNLKGVEFNNCVNYGTIRGLYGVAGIVGYAVSGTSSNYITFSNCANAGEIKLFDSNNDTYAYSKLTDANKNKCGYIGGIAGMGGSYHQYINCVNIGTITGPNSNQYGTGGIAGSIFSANLIDGCINLGDIHGEQSIGGIVGRVSRNAKAIINNTFSAGAVDAVNASGGFVGASSGATNVIQNSYSASKHSAKFYGYTSYTLTNNTEYTISDSALEVLREIQLFECEQVQDNASKQAKYEALNEALNNLTGQDDLVVLEREWKVGTTYMAAANYVRSYCSYSVSTIFGSGLLSTTNFDNKLLLIILLSVLSSAGIIAAIVVNKRKHN